MKKSDILLALEPVVNCFEKLRIPYYIGGSFASSAYGIARATADIDMVTQLHKFHIEEIIKELSSDYFIDEPMILEAVITQSSFNILHLATGIKIDIFLLGDSEYSQKTAERIKRDTFNDGTGEVEIYLCSAEDIILNKLLWFKKGNMTSQKQWLDILGVVKVQKGLLDIKYLEYWSAKLEVKDLFNKALLESEEN